MAVTIIRYPGGLEYPEFWKNNIRGLTPTSSYTLSFDQALNKFPGLEYDAQFNALKNSTQSQETAPTAPTSYIDIKVADPATSEPQSNDDEFYQYEQDLDSYNKTIEADKQKQAELSKIVEDKRAIYLSGLKDPAAIRAAYDELQSAIKTSSDYATSTIGKYQRPNIPTNYRPTGRALPTPIQTTSFETEEPKEEKNQNIIENFTNKLLDQAKGEAVTWPSISPEIEENLEIVREQAVTDNVDSKQFLDSYVAGSEPAVAQNQGPSTPVKYDEGMKQYVPNPGAGRPGNVRLKNPPPFAQGPRGEYVGEIAAEYPADRWNRDDEVLLRSLQKGEMGGGPNIDKAIQDLLRQKLKGAEAPEIKPRGETVVAQALPSGPRGMDRPPGTYHPSNIMPLITPGSRFSDKESYMIQDPFKNSPQTGPGLSERESRAVNVAIRTADEQKASQAFQSEYDPQKARTATSAAKEYKKQSQAEDPFRSSAFG